MSPVPTLDLIYLVAPTSTEERLAIVARVARGCLYCVALSGVTGLRSQVSAVLPAYLSRVRRTTDLPLAVGFGISRPEHVHAIAQHADGAIVGAALVGRLAAFSPEEGVDGVAAHVRAGDRHVADD
jgi:tryptophan synthase alpha subunit